MKVFGKLNSAQVYKHAVQTQQVKIDEDRTIEVVVFKRPKDPGHSVSISIINGTITTSFYLSLEAAMALGSAIGMIEFDKPDIQKFTTWVLEHTTV